MRLQANIGELQRITGLATWAAVTGFGIYFVITNGGHYNDAIPFAFALALINLGATWVAMGASQSPRVTRHVALWVQLGSALAAALLIPISFAPIYTIIWIAVATGYYPLRVCWWLLGGVLLAWFVIMRFAWGTDGAMTSVVLYGTFHMFAMLSASNVSAAQVARDKVESLNRELVATQHLLAEASRQGERTRIARDLHDLLGHHLTALSINLQIAERMASGDAKTKVEECRALARLLLSDVRETVSRLRDNCAIDLARAISLIVDNVPLLQVNLDVDEDLTVDDVDVAETLLRCIQEGITNTLKHSGANRSWIRVWQDDDIHLQMWDDGIATDKLHEGNGLAGMRERLAEINGTLKLDRVGRALQLRVDIPVPG